MSLPEPYYQDEQATIYCGDCETILPHLPKVDICLTDPPYGLDFKGAGWDKEVPEIAYKLPILYGRVVIITAPLVMRQYPDPKWVGCWVRPASSSRSLAGGFNHWSPILLYGDCSLKVDTKSFHAIKHAYPKGFGHPSPKPEILMRWLCEETSGIADTILDPFMGSGTTLVAAKQLGRKAIGVEISEAYCAIAVDRLRQGVLDF